MVEQAGNITTATGQRIFGLTPANIPFRSQLESHPYFLVATILFFLQIPFGLILAAQYVWPTFLMNVLPFNIARETHLNILIIWLLIGLMGASYYLVPEETKSDIFSVRLARSQLWVLIVAAVGTLISFWFLRTSRGKPFTESPLPWPYFIALGAVLFLFNVGMTLYRSKRWNPITGVLFGGMAALAGLYLIDMAYIKNLTVDFYWWWWIIHLWVEGAWELVAAAIMAYLLIRLTGVERKKLYKWLYIEVMLVLFTGFAGIGHHYYWIGTPSFWQPIGAVGSMLQPIPILLMAIDALTDMRERKVKPANMVAWYFLGGSAIMHFVGAGIWGFAQSQPAINQWTHGTQITASHGHFAFFGAFAMLVVGAIYLMVPQMRGMKLIREGRGMWGFWLMTTGMLAMVGAFTIAGVVQVYLWRMTGLDFMTVKTQYESFWLLLVFIFGFVLFLPGVIVYLWDFFGMKGISARE
jgi:nitric oxide reductase subunit B